MGICSGRSPALYRPVVAALAQTLQGVLLRTAITGLAVCLAVLAQTGQAEEPPYIHILGVAQDAGYPQAGCYQPHCMPGWQDPNQRRTVSSIALVDPGAGKKYIIDATPGFPEQLYQLEQVAPDRDITLAGIFLTHAHIGHYTGLMYLGREAMGTSNIPVYAMPRMRQFLETNGPWSQLVKLNNIQLHTLQNNTPVQLTSGLQVTPYEVPHRDEYSETIAFRIDGPDRSALFVPDIDKWALWNRDIREEIKSVDYALLDASFFADGELPKRAMDEVPHPFVTESMVLFDEMSDRDKQRVIFIHMNHSNPLLDDDSLAHRQVIKAGYQIAKEGLSLPL